MVNWDQLISERNAWVSYNFPHSSSPPPTESVIGCIEEVGELAHAHLKEAQAIRGTAEQHQAAAQDSVGDLIVYLLGVMSYYKVTPTEGRKLFPHVDDSYSSLLRLSAAAGTLSDTVLAGGVGKRLAIERVIYYAHRYCDLRGWQFHDIVQGTWDAVKQRDWIRYPDTGLPPEPEAPTEILPREDGDIIILGPEVFASKDGTVVSWQGRNYVPQSPLGSSRAA
jgi:hypothetical protein